MQKLLGCKHISTTAYHPQGNGVSEALNKQLKLTMKKLMVSYQELPLSTILAFSLMALRSLTHTTTAESPFFVLTGTDMRLPVLMTQQEELGEPWPERAAKSQQLREEIFFRTMNQIKINDDKTVVYQPAVDELVLVRLSDQEQLKRRHVFYGSFCTPEWSLPKRVKETWPDRRKLTVVDIYSQKESTHSFDNIKPFLPQLDQEQLDEVMRNEIRYERGTGSL